jgi:hypothetical protein
MFLTSAIPSTIQFFLSISLPESPRYLLKVSAANHNKAKKIFMRVYNISSDAEDTSPEIQSIEALMNSISISVALTKDDPSVFSRLKMMFKDGPTRRAMFLSW